MPVSVAVGVAVAVGVGTLTTASVMTAIAIGMAAASFTMAMTMKVPKPRPAQQELKQMLRSSRPPKSVIYGQTMVSGALLFAEEQVGDTRNDDDGTYNEWLYMAVGIADHAIHSAVNLYMNETPVVDFGRYVNYQVHSADGTVDQYLVDNAPSWSADMVGGNTTWLRLAMLFNRDLFANGVPTPKLELKGKLLWDMRTNTTAYSNNAALVIADFLTEYMGFSRDRLITSGHGSFIAAANLCDEAVTNPDGSTSNRYTINGVFRMDQKPSDVLHDMLASCGGILVRIGGKVGLMPAAYYGISTFTVNESHLVGDVNIQPEQSYDSAINTIKGTFVDPSQTYAETDFPPLVDAEALARDGGELSDDLKLNFVTDPYQAQRLADIQLKRSLTGGALEIPVNLIGLNCYEGRVIEVDLPQLGIIGEYRVVRTNMHLQEGVTLTLQRDDISIYDDAIGEVFIPPPLTNLPVGGIAAPSGVQFLVDTVGEVVQGKITWQINYPQSVSSDIRVKRVSDDAVMIVGQSVSNFWKVNGLPADNYIVEVRSVSSTGKVSNWASASFVVDVPPVPDSVTVNASNWNIELLPVVNTGIPSGTVFRFKYLADNQSFLTGTPSYDASDVGLADDLFTGSSFNHGGLTPDRYHHYWVQGINSYGQSDWLYVRTGTTREQDLITTVVERLVAIEIVSGNFVEGSQGYKIWGADPNDPTADGRVEFNDGTFRGHLVADSLELRGGTTIDYSSVSGDKPTTSQVSQAQATADSKIVTFYQATTPTALSSGDIWFDTDDNNKSYRWNGSAWVDVQDDGIGQAISAAAGAQATADGKVTTFYQSVTPTAEGVGDLWVDTGNDNRLYRWGGSSWQLVRDLGIGQAISAAATAQATADGKVTTFFQPTTPTAEGMGDLWVDTNDGNKSYRWNGSAWESIQDANINQALSNAATAQATADGKIVTFYQTTTPSASAVGDIWFDTDDGNKEYRWNGSSWISVQDSGIGQAISAASAAQITADGKIVTFYQTTAPTAEGEGDLWIDTDDGNKSYRWNGSSWVVIQDTSISQALSDAATAQATADGKITTFYQATAPTADATGDIWFDTDDGNKEYRWNGSVWVDVRDTGIGQAISAASAAQITADGKIVTFYQATTPTAEGAGDLWIDTDDGNKSYRWNGSAWVAIQDANINQALSNAATAQATADGKIVTFYQTTAPSAEGVGDIWFDTDDGNKQYRWNGSAWVDVRDSGIGQAITAAAGAQATADGKITTFYQTTAPTAEGVGDLWVDTDDGNKSYRWSGSAWVAIQDAGINQALSDAATAQATADGKIVTYRQSSSPSGASDGDLWIDSDNNRLYRHNGTGWIQTQDAGINQALSNAATAQATADGKIVTFYQATAPTAEGVGDIWFDTDDGNKQYRWNGSAWVSAQDSGIDQALGGLAGLYPDQTNLSIFSSNYVAGAAGWALDNNGNFEGNNGVFRGTILADKIDGNVVSAKLKDAPRVYGSAYDGAVFNLVTFTVSESASRDRTLFITGVVATVSGGATSNQSGNIDGVVRGTGTLGTVPDVECNVYIPNGNSTLFTTSSSNVVEYSTSINVPAGATGDITISLVINDISGNASYYSASIQGSYNNYERVFAQLIPVGSDLL